MSNRNLNSRLMFSNSFFLLVNLLVKLFVSLCCSRLILQELGVVDYGIYNVVGGVVTLLSFLTGSISSSTQRFLSYEIGRNDNEVSKVFSMSLNVHFVIALVAIICSQTVGLWFVENILTIPDERMDATFWVFQSSVISFVILIFGTPYNAVLIAYEKIKIYSYMSMFVVIVNLLLVLCLMLIEGDKLVFYSSFVVIGSIFSFLMPYIYVKINIKSITYQWSFNSELFKSMLSFTGWSLYGNLSGVGFNQGVSILLNIFFGPTVNAARAVSSQINGALLGLVGNVNIAANPQIIKSYSSGQKEQMMQLVFAASKYSFLFLSLCSLPILVNIDYVLNLWLGNVPKYSNEFATLVIIDSLVCGFSGSLMTSIQATGRIKYYQMTIGTILLLNIPISYLLLKCYDNTLIPFIVTILLSIVAFKFRILFVKKYFGISIVKYLKTVVCGPLISFVFSTATIVYLQYSIELVGGSFLITSILSLLVSVFYIWCFSLSIMEKRFLKRSMIIMLRKLS